MVIALAPIEMQPLSERPLSLTSRELRRLRRVVRDQKQHADRRSRARALLLAARAQDSRDIAHELGLPVDQVRQLRARFGRSRLAALEDEAGPIEFPVDSPEANDQDAVRITLVGSERRELRRVVAAHKSEQRAVLRAKIVLLAAQGRNNCEIADELGCHVQTVRKWRARFASGRLENLRDLPRPGRTPQFEASVRHKAIAALLGPPLPGFARWTLDSAVQALIERKIVTTISRETLSRWLRSFDLKPHRCRYWLESKDPEFQPKMDAIVDLYLNKPRNGRVICIDEKTCIPARERIRPDQPARPGRVRRQEFEYRRHGTVHLIAAFEVHTGRVFTKCVDKNDSDAFIEFLREVRRQYPREKLYLVMDNGTTHRSEATTKFLATQPRMVPVFTPTHASWLNQVEIWFSALSRRSLRHMSFDSREALIRHIEAFVAAHNQTAKPYRWTKTGEALRA